MTFDPTMVANPVDVNYQGILTDVFPAPILYLCSADVRADPLFIPVVKRYGLPQLRIDGPEDAGTLVVVPAVGDEWKVLIGPGSAFTVAWPYGQPLVYGGGMSTPGWCEAALEAGECWLMVGPPHTWNNDATVHDLIEKTWKAGGALGVVRVEQGAA